TRVKSGILVSAALRHASANFIDCVLARRGDADAGAIFVHIDALHKLLARSLDFEGNYAWQIITSTEWVDGETATSRLAAETKMDHDAFIIAISDAKARNPFDAL
ncbi:DUF1491 family protein, partial [Alphaproteobacteria bacterium]|nr:DUF1491 family protein [Alphaproteobacteria bacterium]